MPTWRQRLTDAQRFLEVAQAANDPDHGNQAASNAIMAIIAANDAICLSRRRPAPRGDSHVMAAQAMVEALRGTPWERDAAAHARALVEVLVQKNAAQYTGERLSPDAVERILTRTERFVAWAEGIASSG
jgi:hypothetical protein